MRNGDFSELLRLGDVYRIYDPLTGVAEGRGARRQAFPDNRIPADRINAIAKAYLDYYPLPNQPGRRRWHRTTISRRPRVPTPTTA